MNSMPTSGDTLVFCFHFWVKCGLDSFCWILEISHWHCWDVWWWFPSKSKEEGWLEASGDAVGKGGLIEFICCWLVPQLKIKSQSLQKVRSAADVKVKEGQPECREHGLETDYWFHIFEISLLQSFFCVKWTPIEQVPGPFCFGLPTLSHLWDTQGGQRSNTGAQVRTWCDVWLNDFYQTFH